VPGGCDAAARMRVQCGRESLMRAEFEQAIIHLTAALHSEPDQVEIYILRGEAFRALGRLAEALADLTIAIAKAPSDHSIRVQYGKVLALLGLHEEALAAFAEVIASNPESIPALLGRAVTHVERRQFPEAIADYSRVLALSPLDFQAYFGRGKVHALSATWDRAVSDFTQVVDLNPAYIPAYIERAHAHRERGEHRQAISDYTEVLTHLRNPSVFVHRGQVFERLGDQARALEDYSAAIELNPTNAVAFARRGRLRRLAEQFEAALSDLDQAVALDPISADPFYDRGMIGLAVEQVPQAIEQFKEAIARSPQHIEAHLNRAIANEKLEKYRHAIRDCNRVLKWQPDHATAFLIRGSVWLSAGNFERAVSDLSDALAIQPDLHLALVRRARALTHLRRWDEAIVDCDRALTLDSGSAAAYAQRSIVHRLMRMPEKAMADLERALKLEPRVLLTILDRGLAEHDRHVNSATLSALAEGSRFVNRAASPRPRSLPLDRGSTPALDLPPRSADPDAAVSLEAEVNLSTSEHEIALPSEPNTDVADSQGTRTAPVDEQVLEESAANVLLGESEAPPPAVEPAMAIPLAEKKPAPSVPSAPVKHRCPMCGAMTIVSAEQANQRVQCSACHVVFIPKAPRPPESAETAARPLVEPRRNSDGPRLQAASQPTRDRARWIAAVIVAGTVATLGGVVAFAISGPVVNHVATHPVRGQVLYDGRPLPNATVTFSPVSASHVGTPPPHGTSQGDGNFTLGTYADSDGAPVGEYKVVVSWKWDVDDLGTDQKVPVNPHQARLGNTKALEISVRVEPGQNSLPAIDVSREVRKATTVRPPKLKGRAS